MDKLFFWNCWHNGDIIFTRPLVRAVMDQHDVEIAWGCFSNHKYLIEDLPVRVLTDPRDDRHPADLSYLCPQGHVPINTWLAQYPEMRRCIWSSVVGTYNRQVEAQGLGRLKIASRWVPMVDFPDVDMAVNDDSIFVANGEARSGQSTYAFNMEALAREFPQLTFYCISDPRCPAPNLIDCSGLNLVRMSALSNRCMALVGIPGGAFDCTFTEPNRFKPRAVMGLSNYYNPTTWEFPGISVEYLSTHEQLKRFLEQLCQRPKLRLTTGARSFAPAPLPPALRREPILAQVKDAITKYTQNTDDEAALALLLDTRQKIARLWAALPSADLAASFAQDSGRIYQALLEFRLGGISLSEYRIASPMGHAAERPEEWAWARALVAPLAGGLTDPAALPGLMAAMLYLDGREIPGLPHFAAIPPWFQQLYLDFILCPPNLHEPGEAAAHAEFLARRTRYLAENVLRYPEAAPWRDLGLYFQQRSNFTALHASAAPLKEMAIHRARLLEQALAISGVAQDHAFPPRSIMPQRIRLGFLVRHVAPRPVTHTESFANGEFKVETWDHTPMSLPEERAALQLCRQLDRNLFDTTIFCLQPRGSDVSLAGDARVIFLPTDLAGQVRAVRDQDLDLLVFVGDLTATAHQVALLALHRLARRHIALTDCPATTGMRHMDFFLSGEVLETAQSPGQYSERLALLPGAGGCGLDETAVGGGATTGINRQMVGIGPADIVFACGASCHKFTPELEESFARILQSIPNSRLLIYPFNPTRLRSYLIPRFLRTLQQRFSRYGLAADRIRIFAPTFNPADIRQWLKLADVYLDAFPFSGFHSVIDALKTALPVVSLEGSCARGRRGAALLRELDVPELIAQSEDEYLRLAVKLGTDAAFRKAEAQRIAAAMRRGPRFMNPASHAADVQRAFCQMAAELFNKR